MKVWPASNHSTPTVSGAVKHRSRPSTDLANWVLHEEKLLVETWFAGDGELYGAWRDRLWTEMHETMHHPERTRRQPTDEEYVVMTAFDGNWAQYRICRDRLREELWQIMKVTKGR